MIVDWMEGWDARYMMQDARCMMAGGLWMVPGCVPCALRLEPYAFVKYRMQETGSGWMIRMNV